MSVIRVAIIDDHPIVRQGLRAVLRVLPDTELAGEASDGEEGVAVVAATYPDVVLMDLMMPGMGGIAAIAELKRRWPDLPVLALTSFSETGLVHDAIRAGADGFVLKDVDVADLAEAIRSVHAGRPYLHPEAGHYLLRDLPGAAETPVVLTPREQEVLAHVARGLTNREIGRALGIAEKTISVHVSKVLRKLGLSSRTQAALYLAGTRLGRTGTTASV